MTRQKQPAELELSGLEVAYRSGTSVVEDLSLRVDAGGITALVGPNGAGKTTVLRAITGLLPAHGGSLVSGEVLLDGRVMTRANPSQVVRAGVAQVLEGRQVFPNLTVDENLLSGTLSLREGRAERYERRDELLALFPILRERIDQRAGFLSGGEQQMLAMARAMMARPRLLILDEPSLGLAPRIVAQIRELIKELNTRSTSILLVEQNALLALEVADRGYVIEHGRIAHSGDAEALASDEKLAHYYLGTTSNAGRRERRRRRLEAEASVGGSDV